METPYTRAVQGIGAVWIFLAALALALAFQGARGLWEPDEGFYANVVLGMARSHDWLAPKLNGEPFLDKPPLLYWAAALGVKAFGTNEWGLRVPNAVAFALAALLVGLMAARWWGDRVGRFAALVYATSLGPYLAANIVTPDTLLSLATAAAYYGFWRQRTAASALARWGWAVFVGVAVGAGALAKGPAALVFAAPIALLALHDRFSGGLGLGPSCVTTVVFLGTAVPWYWMIVHRIPGAASYLFDSQVLGRLFSDEFERNPGPLGGLAVYLPTLAIGILPWGLVWLPRIRALGAAFRRLRGRRWAMGDPTFLLASWLLVPLAILMMARSRLPLYALPLFAPLALLAARQLAHLLPATTSAIRRGAVLAAVWILLLLGGKAEAARVPFEKDSRWVANELSKAGVAPSRQLVTVDTKKNGLALYGWYDIVQATFDPTPYPFFSPPRPIRDVVEACRRQGSQPVFVASPTTTERLEALLRDAGLRFKEPRIDLPYTVLVIEGTEPAPF